MSLVEIEISPSLWEQFFSIFPLVIVGSREPDGSYDLAPKHLAMPMSWENHYGFVCAPHHRTYQNILTNKQFTVSFPRPDQILAIGLTADPRAADHTKPALRAVPTFPAQQVDSVFVNGAYLFLECKLEKVIDDLGTNSLIIGEIVAAQADEVFLRAYEKDDQELIYNNPLLAYLYPSRFATISQTLSFPFPKDFKR